jgi:hypothetical protein
MAATQSISLLQSSFQQPLDRWFTSILEQVDNALARMPEPQFASRYVSAAELPYCQMWFARGSAGDADQCDNRAMIGDLEIGMHACVECFRRGVSE